MRVLRRPTTVLAVLALAVGASAAYTVKPGDNLTAIAARFGVRVSDIVQANGLEDPDRITVGKSLEIPTPNGLPAAVLASSDRRALVPTFHHWADANVVPRDLLMALAWVESGWQNGVVSSTGAIGIGQLMPRTTEFVRTVLIGRPALDPLVPDNNIRMSARYLGWLLQLGHGDVRHALASYYQGPGSLAASGMHLDTFVYVNAILALRGRFTSV